MSACVLDCTDLAFQLCDLGVSHMMFLSPVCTIKRLDEIIIIMLNGFSSVTF